MDKLKMHSINKVDENIAKIGTLFPNCLTERKNENGVVEYAIDFDILRQELSSVVVEGNEERYQFTWPDKKKSILLANSPIAKTLRPCREESVDFDTTENLYIEGDNLDVLKLLQETYLGKIKMIYIDPPYNTGHDFVYEDDFVEDADAYLTNSGQFDEDGNRLVENTESNGRFHTDWLNMIYPRLKLAKDLLSDDGALFISINDYEADNLRKVCDEIFGRENFVAQVVWQKSKKGDAKLVSICHEYVLMYVKAQKQLLADGIKWRQPKQGLDEIFAHYESLRSKYGSNHAEIQKQMKLWYNSLPADHPARGSKHYNYSDDRGLYFADNFAGPDDGRVSRPRYDIIHPITGLPCKKPSTGWRWDEKRTKAAMEMDPPLIHFGPTHETIPCRKSYLKDVDSEPFNSVFYKDGRSATLKVEQLVGKGVFDFPKDDEVLARLFGLVADSDKEAYILDFFSGSASSANAVMQMNVSDGGKRKFIMVQLPEECDKKSGAHKAGYSTICEIGKTRIRRAGQKIKEESPLTTQELDTGFRVLKLDSSNMKDVYYTPADYEMSMFDTLADNIKEDRTPEDLLFQVMLDLGVLLSSKIEEAIIAGKKVFNVADGFLMACFDENVSDETITAVAKQKPYYFVMRDSSLASDSVATNFDQIFATYSPDTVRKVL